MRVSVGSQPPTRQIPCNMTCMWPAKDMGLVKRAHIIGSNLTVVLSMEGPAHYADLRPARRKFSAYATGNMLSDIPHPWLTNLSQIFTRPSTIGRLKTRPRSLPATATRRTSASGGSRRLPKSTPSHRCRRVCTTQTTRVCEEANAPSGRYERSRRCVATASTSPLKIKTKNT